MTATSLPGRQDGWRTPFVVILCGCLIGLLSFGPRSVVGMFLNPISVENGWTRDVLSLTIAVQNLMWGVGQPFAGAIADRFGTLKVFWAGAIMYAAGLACMALPLPPLAMHVISGSLVGLGLAGVSFNLVLACFAKLLPENRRASAMGMGTAASSFGQFVFAPLTPLLIDLFGWKVALLVFSAVPVLIFPLALALATSPAAGIGTGTGSEKSIAATLKEAFAHPSYVYLVIGFFTCGFQLAFITTHYPTYLADLRMPAWVAGSALALIGLFNIFGSLGAVLAHVEALAAGLDLLRPRCRGDPSARPAAQHTCRADLRCAHGAPVALHRAADLRPRRPDVRHALHGHALWLRVLLAPGRRLPRRLAGRRHVRANRLLRDHVVA
jgi:MFS family permease